MTTIAPPHGCGGCAPCSYQRFEEHRDGCSICLSAPTAHDYCTVGLALLDAALGRAGLPQRLIHVPEASARRSIYRPGLVPNHELVARTDDAVLALEYLDERVPRNAWGESTRRRAAHRLAWARWRFLTRHLNETGVPA